MAHQKGAVVRQVVPTIIGTVTERRFSDERDVFEYLVEYVGTDGEKHARWFTENEIEVQA